LTLFPALATSHEASHSGSPGSLAPYIWPGRLIVAHQRDQLCYRALCSAL
jgi:hypothetical protein